MFFDEMQVMGQISLLKYVLDIQNCSDVIIFEDIVLMVFIFGLIGVLKVVEISYGNFYVVMCFVLDFFEGLFVDVNIFSYLLFCYVVEQNMIVVNCFLV